MCLTQSDKLKKSQQYHEIRGCSDDVISRYRMSIEGDNIGIINN